MEFDGALIPANESRLLSALNERGKMLIRCRCCRTHALDYPFVHQYCQHVVCSRCSYKQKDELYCSACRGVQVETSLLVGQAVKNGHSSQVSALVGALFPQHMDEARARVARDAPAAHAESTIQTSVLVNATTFKPVYDRIRDRGKKSEPYCGDRRCCCLINWGCACCSWCGDKLVQMLSASLAFMMMVGVLWFFWFLWSGETTLHNAPLFNQLPYKNMQEQSSPVTLAPLAEAIKRELDASSKGVSTVNLNWAELANSNKKEL